jgi:diguanylate cyclase (GGDEF)-like protein
MLDDVRFVYQPLVNVNTSGVAAVELIARPTTGSLHEMFRTAARNGNLTQLDIALAELAARSAAEQETLLPLHINLLAGTVARDPDAVERLHETMLSTCQSVGNITLEIGGPFSRIEPNALISGLNWLREAGYGIALDGVGSGDLPLALIAEISPDLIKLDRTVVRGVTRNAHYGALVESTALLCETIDAQLAAEQVDAQHQLTALRRKGVRILQGDLLAPAGRRPPTRRTLTNLPGSASPDAEPPRPRTREAGPRVVDYLQAAVTLPGDATSEDVRNVLANEQVSGVVLLDEGGRPEFTIDRNRFLLAVTGPYGHALHAKRPAARLADTPRLIRTDITAMEAFDQVAGSDPSRMYDDVVVIDGIGRCLGTVRISDLFRGIAQMKVEEAAALNPLTRLPGSDAIGAEVGNRIAAGVPFAVSWLDIDGFKGVNDTAGYAAGDELIREIGRALGDTATALGSALIGHVGGDDFLFVTDLDDLVSLASVVMDTDRMVADRQVTLSLATIQCTPGKIGDYHEASRLLAPLKRHAKALRGNSWVFGRPGAERVDVLRGSGPCTMPGPHPRPVQRIS